MGDKKKKKKKKNKEKSLWQEEGVYLVDSQEINPLKPQQIEQEAFKLRCQDIMKEIYMKLIMGDPWLGVIEKHKAEGIEIYGPFTDPPEPGIKWKFFKKAFCQDLELTLEMR